MLIEGPALFFPAFVPAQDFTELTHEVAVGEEISTLSDKGGCVDVLLGEEVDGFEKFVVCLAVVESAFDALEEMGLVSGWRSWSCGWGRDGVSGRRGMCVGMVTLSTVARVGVLGWEWGISIPMDCWDRDF
jgi:hypothetical protein